MKKFEIYFNSFIVLIALGIITAYTMDDFQIMYIIIGVIIASSSIIRLYQITKKKSE